MAKTRHILKRVRAIRNIRTVTKAMQTVASVRFRKVHDRSESFRPFSSQMTDMVAELTARAGEGELRHPLLETPSGVRRDVLLVLTTNRGLCGSYNSAVLYLTMERLRQFVQAGHNLELHVAGKRGIRYLGFRRLHIDRVYDELGDEPSYRDVADIADAMMRDFLGGRISGLEVAYMQFLSAGQQRPAIAQLLPLSDLPAGRLETGDRGREYEFMPAPSNILRRLLPATVRLKLYQCFLDAGSAEQLMRMSAMQSATDNADDMIHELKVLGNRLRQLQITTELAEIVGGQAGREGQ